MDEDQALLGYERYAACDAPRLWLLGIACTLGVTLAAGLWIVQAMGGPRWPLLAAFAPVLVWVEVWPAPEVVFLFLVFCVCPLLYIGYAYLGVQKRYGLLSIAALFHGICLLAGIWLKNG